MKKGNLEGRDSNVWNFVKNQELISCINSKLNSLVEVTDTFPSVFPSLVTIFISTAITVKVRLPFVR